MIDSHQLPRAYFIETGPQGKEPAFSETEIKVLEPRLSLRCLR